MDAASEPEHIRQLREAVRLSPDNIPLRQALADALLAAGLSTEAVTAYRAALALAPNQPALKFGLARAFHADGKSSHALVVLEDLVKSPESPGRAFVLHAKILAGIGEIEQAVEQYKTGVAKDRSAADPAEGARQQAHHRETGHRFARAGFADERGCPPFFDAEIHTAHRDDIAGLGPEGHFERPDF